MDVLLRTNGIKEELRQAVLTKLNAAKGGGFIFRSDHSVPEKVSAERFEYVLGLVRKYAVYPLKLGELNLPDLG